MSDCPTVSVTAGQDAQEGGQLGCFVFTRTDTVGTLSVTATMSQPVAADGSVAYYGSDYSDPPTTGIVTFLAGSSITTLNVVPGADTPSRTSP